MLASPNGMSATGSGPKIMLVALPVIVAAILARIAWPETVSIGLPPGLLYAFGLVALSAGVAFWAASVFTFVNEFPKGRLITTGPYAYCRHPIYASVALLVLPGVALLANCWVFFLAAAVMLAASKWFVRDEDRELEATFGAEYRLYRAGVPEFLPAVPPQRKPPALEA